ncbi:MAG: hypothetical protein GY870_22045 [archaeon]|nr:hypothetical protein [archaeon]
MKGNKMKDYTFDELKEEMAIFISNLDDTAKDEYFETSQKRNKLCLENFLYAFLLKEYKPEKMESTITISGESISELQGKLNNLKSDRNDIIHKMSKIYNK